MQVAIVFQAHLSSQVLCMTMVERPPMKISEVYSSMARLLSPTYGTYLITTMWSGCSPGLYKMLLLATMSSTTFDLLISCWQCSQRTGWRRHYKELLKSVDGSLEQMLLTRDRHISTAPPYMWQVHTSHGKDRTLERKVWGADRFMPSLLPRWLYETMEVGLMPAPTRKSTSTLFIFVCPDLKSSPPISTPSWTCYTAVDTVCIKPTALKVVRDFAILAAAADGFGPQSSACTHIQ